MFSHHIGPLPEVLVCVWSVLYSARQIMRKGEDKLIRSSHPQKHRAKDQREATNLCELLPLIHPSFCSRVPFTWFTLISCLLLSSVLPWGLNDLFSRFVSCLLSLCCLILSPHLLLTLSCVFCSNVFSFRLLVWSGLIFPCQDSSFILS